MRIIDSGDDLTAIRNLQYYFAGFATRTIKYSYGIAKKYGFNQNRIDMPVSSLKEELRFNATDSTITPVYELKREEKIDQAIAPSDGDTWEVDYKKKLFKVYLKIGNYRGVSKATKIPMREIQHTLKSFREELKSKASE